MCLINITPNLLHEKVCDARFLLNVPKQHFRKQPFCAIVNIFSNYLFQILNIYDARDHREKGLDKMSQFSRTNISKYKRLHVGALLLVTLLSTCNQIVSDKSNASTSEARHTRSRVDAIEHCTIDDRAKKRKSTRDRGWEKIRSLKHLLGLRSRIKSQILMSAERVGLASSWK